MYLASFDDVHGCSPLLSIPYFISNYLPSCIDVCRYQNQRHPSNKLAAKPNVTQSSIGEHVSTVPGQASSTAASSIKREPLLPTPPSNQMVKLDTSLTCKHVELGRSDAKELPLRPSKKLILCTFVSPSSSFCRVHVCNHSNCGLYLI